MNYAFSQTLYFVHGVRSQLARVVSNIVVNALRALQKADSSGASEIHVAAQNHYVPPVGIDTTCAAPCVEISFRDTGVGMSPAQLARCREPQFTTKTDSASHGMGLPIVKTILADHDGGFDIAATPGVGTTVRIFLPVSSNNYNLKS